jgi:hypothetical protein
MPQWCGMARGQCAAWWGLAHHGGAVSQGSDVVQAGGVMGGMMWCGNVVGQGNVVGSQQVKTHGRGTTVGQERVSVVPHGGSNGGGCLPWCVTGAVSLHSIVYVRYKAVARWQQDAMMVAGVMGGIGMVVVMWP